MRVALAVADGAPGAGRQDEPVRRLAGERGRGGPRDARAEGTLHRALIEQRPAAVAQERHEPLLDAGGQLLFGPAGEARDPFAALRVTQTLQQLQAALRPRQDPQALLAQAPDRRALDNRAVGPREHALAQHDAADPAHAAGAGGPAFPGNVLVFLDEVAERGLDGLPGDGGG